MADVGLPFKVDYAKSGRASCRSCKSSISKDDLRLASVVQSASFDGKMTKWFHFACFFLKNKPKSTGDIDGFSNIKYEDQKRIEKKVGTGGGTAEIAGRKSVSAKEKKNATLEYSVDHAKSGRSTCRHCDMLIAKDQVRISKMVYDSERALAYGPYPGWYHVECFLANREMLDWYLPAQDLPGFKSLAVEDQKMLKEKIPKIAPVKRPAEEENSEPAAKKKKPDEESALKKQSDKLFKLQKQVETEMTKRQITEIFEYNNLHVPTGISRMTEWLADAIVFGVCDPCPECKQKALRFKNNVYKCYGDFSEFTTCEYTTTDPKRSKIKVPKEFLQAFPFLKGSVGRRVIPSVVAKPTVTPKAEARQSKTVKALAGCQIVIEATDQEYEIVKSKVLSFGGKIVKQVSEDTLCVISTQENVAEMSSKVKKAKKLDVFVVSEDFLEKCKNNGSVNLKSHRLVDWGDEARLSKILSEAQKSASELSLKSGKSMFSKSGESTVKVKLNGLVAVDPDSGLDGIAKVYQKGKEVYNCVLGLADVSRGTNSYYKLQLLESRGSYFVFRAWGRIGTTIGGNKLQEHSTLQDALLDFKGIFLEKTGNDWESRKNFVKKPRYFDIIEMDLMQDESSVDTKQILATSSDSKLPLPVQELICNIFDVNLMNQQMREFEIDLQKMPLGKISKEQITKAYKVLTELQALVDKESSRLQFLDASNRFFTIIPHDFGIKTPPLLDNINIIKEKVDMLDSLGEMELTMKLLKQEKTSTSLPVDHHYTQLKADIQVLPRDGATFGVLQKYVTTTHAETHSAYELEILDVFTVAREGEGQRFKPFKRLHNRKLLWHGSRLSNFAGIISQGLRIAPPEAPVTGYMFGKGIYFADMVSKSANYCCTTPANPVGLLLLCEVALGDMHELTQAKNITKLPEKKHSVKGIGKTQPANEETLDGAVVPMGPSKKSDVNTSLLYNEYIVYDVAQVHVKYLMKVNFKFKY